MSRLFLPTGLTVGRRLFTVLDVFMLNQRPGAVIVSVDLPLRLAPVVSVGQRLEFRNPDGSVLQALLSGIEMADPPNPERPFSFLVRSNSGPSAVQVGAEVWSLDEDGRA